MEKEYQSLKDASEQQQSSLESQLTKAEKLVAKLEKEKTDLNEKFKSEC